MTDKLANKTCRTLKPGSPALSKVELKFLLPSVPSWTIKRNELTRTLKFKNYYETMAFVNATAYISNQQDHHPDLTVTYNTVEIRYSTHSVGGLSENDFICAAKINQL